MPSRPHRRPFGRLQVALRRLLLAALVAGCVSNPQQGADRGAGSSLDQWVDEVLAPYLVDQLASHPRFKGETLLLAKLHDSDVEPQMDSLTASLRDRLQDRLMETPGVRLAWRPSSRPWDHHRNLSQVRCQSPGNTHYVIGIETTATPDGGLRVAVRALDLRDGSWVPGFGRSWRGKPDAWQRQALQQSQTDEYLRGLRVLPFAADQADLAAAYLAHNLSCLIRQSPVEDPVVQLQAPDSDPAPVRTTFELLGNYLSRFHEVQITRDPGPANLSLSGEAHLIRPGVYQLWAVLQSKQQGLQLAGTDTSTYLEVSRYAAATRSTAAVTLMPADRHPDPPTGITARPIAPRLSPLRVLVPRDSRLCGSRHPWGNGERVLSTPVVIPRDGCFALELDKDPASSLFLFELTSHGRLLRMLPGDCHPLNQAAADPGGGEQLRYPARWEDFAASVLSAGGQPGIATFYAVAVADPVAAARLGRHLSRLPEVCDDANRELASAATEAWLAQLDRLMREGGPEIQWQARRIRRLP